MSYGSESQYLEVHMLFNKSYERIIQEFKGDWSFSTPASDENTRATRVLTERESLVFNVYNMAARYQVASGTWRNVYIFSDSCQRKTSFKFNRQEIAQAVAQLENKRCTSSAEVSDIT